MSIRLLKRQSFEQYYFQRLSCQVSIAVNVSSPRVQRVKVFRYLIYCRNCLGGRMAVGIVEAHTATHAVARAYREEWEYSIEKRVGWHPNETAEAVCESRVSTKHWWEVVEIHRLRRQGWFSFYDRFQPTPLRYTAARPRTWQKNGPPNAAFFS